MTQICAIKLARIKVRGVVQGVGFRPFVFHLAHQYNLRGWVRNTSSEVEINVEGDENSLKSFIYDLSRSSPSASHIESVESLFTEPEGYTGFEIKESVKQKGKYQLVSPDLATCEDCKREIFDPTDRRFRYTFTNCTNCGPRFTIIEDIPYDRTNTTMSIFKMCPHCQNEYENPADRRFHAQPNACPDCGPRLELVDNMGKIVSCTDIIHQAAVFLKEGKILALRGLGGFQLACDATNATAINLLRERKSRPAKPFAVMFSGKDHAVEHCLLSREEIELLESPGAPIVLVKWEKARSNIAGAVAPNNKYLGAMLPYTPLHHLLMRETRLPLIMTSGNLSEEPIAKDNDEALRRLHGIADYFILHNREIYARYDDSVCVVGEGEPQVLRRARGYAPYPIFLPCKLKSVLACGAEEKNTFCLTKQEHAFLSQHIGDLENEETLEHFEKTVELYKQLFRIMPEVVACDMHPDYLSSEYAKEVSSAGNIALVPVQHHHAHIVSCMVENKINHPVIGVAFDGTGYGLDGTIWGGEFLVADWHSFRRAGHLQYIPMPGGAVSIKKPYRMALGYLYSISGNTISLDALPLLKFCSNEFDIVVKQLKRKINTPLTSSAGRLFDAVSALLGVCGEITYSAQAAIELEMLATGLASNGEAYPVMISEQNGEKIINLDCLISALLQDIRSGMPVERISVKFHRSVAAMIVEMCRLISRDTGLNDVVLSGGVFQNRVLQTSAVAALRKAGYNVYIHHLVPCNDGGIALGQAVIAGLIFDQGNVICV